MKNIAKIYFFGEKSEKNDKNEIISINKNTNQNENDDDNNNICILCLNKYNQVCCTPCGHLFCWTCIHLFLTEKNFCPKCKMKCQPQEVLFLQNYL